MSLDDESLLAMLREKYPALEAALPEVHGAALDAALADLRRLMAQQWEEAALETTEEVLPVKPRERRLLMFARLRRRACDIREAALRQSREGET